jgi:hypothetical protein
MPDSQLDRDLSALAQLARKSTDAVEAALAGLPNSQRAAVRGHLSAAVLTIIAGAYVQDRERYRDLDPPIPPTPVPKPSL